MKKNHFVSTLASAICVALAFLLIKRDARKTSDPVRKARLKQRFVKFSDEVTGRREES